MVIAKFFRRLVEYLMTKLGSFVFCLGFACLAAIMSWQEIGAARTMTQIEAAPLITIGKGAPLPAARASQTRNRSLLFCDTYLKTDRILLLPADARDRFVSSCDNYATDNLRGTPFAGQAHLVRASAAALIQSPEKARENLSLSRQTSPFHGRTAQRRLLLALHMDSKGVEEALVGADHDVRVMLSGFGLRTSLAGLYQQLSTDQQAWLISAIETAPTSQQNAFVGRLRQLQDGGVGQ